MLLVESAQSVANRLENTIWDRAAQDVVEPRKGNFLRGGQAGRQCADQLPARSPSPQLLLHLGGQR